MERPREKKKEGNGKEIMGKGSGGGQTGALGRIGVEHNLQASRLQGNATDDVCWLP